MILQEYKFCCLWYQLYRLRTERFLDWWKSADGDYCDLWRGQKVPFSEIFQYKTNQLLI